MNIDDLTLGQIKQLRGIFGEGKCDDGHPFEIGEPYFIRTVTYHLTGTLVRVTAQELVIEHAAWIADDGRFMQAMEKGEFKEVEPYPDSQVIVGRGSIIDAIKVQFKLPRSQK